MVDIPHPGTQPPSAWCCDPFVRWADWLAAHAALVLSTGLAALLALASGVGAIEFETHAERFLASDHPARLRYESFKQAFGLDTAIFVLIEAEDVFDPAFLDRLNSFHEALEADLPHLDEVRSLASARLLDGGDDVLRAGEVRDELPVDRAGAETIFRRLSATSTHPGHVFARDRGLTAVAVRLDAFDWTGAADAGGGDPPPLSATESGRVVERVRALAAEAWPDHAWHLAGNPVVNARLAAAFARDTLRFAAIALATIALALAALFRRPSAVVLPLAIVLLSIAATLGAAGRLGVKLNVTIQILPAFLLAIGASAAIHLLVLFYQHLDAGASRRQAVASALGHAGPALVATSATTAAGLGSFAMAHDLAPVALLGVIAPIGVAMTLFAVVGLLPAALVLLPIRPARGASRSLGTQLGIRLARVGQVVLRAPGRALGLAGLVFALSVLALLRIDAANDALAYFPEGDPIRTATRVLDERLSGSVSMEVVVEAPAGHDVRSPELIAALDGLGAAASAIPPRDGARINHVVSLADVLREIHDALASPAAGEPALPDESALIAQELLLFESTGADDLERVATTDYSSTRITLRAPWVPSQHYLELVPGIESLLRETLPAGYEVSTTGLLVLFAEAVEAISHGFRTSYATALLLIALMMVAFLRSLQGGLLSMIPNLLPIAITLGVMGLVGIDLDLFTMLIGSIAIGLAVDDTVHLSHAFRRGWERHGDLEKAVTEGFEATGSAIVTSSIVLCLGFVTYAFSPMANLAAFGLLTSLSIALALVADVLLLPPVFALSLRRGASSRQARLPLATR
ncbi:MAG: MMPL family transporter [Spirochaetaceae bacterium]|nr:MMPL family transporter [Spirochaetaceae bacterium]